ncbi:MAG: flagellar biosynthetic protein FliO [Myxococcales bacterium]|nr:flagellar biosynthetic protein FliO [Myxococcales bacterium]
MLADAAQGSYALDLLRSLLALVFVCLLAWVSLRLLARRGLGLGLGSAGNDSLRVEQRVTLDSRHSLVVVRAGGRRLLLGVGQGAAPRLIAELEPEAADAAPPTQPAVDGGEGG